jgi:hypothetical protein
MNKYKFWGIIAGLSSFLSVFGYWAKVTHKSYADILFAIGMWLLAVSAGVYVYFKFLKFRNNS